MVVGGVDGDFGRVGEMEGVDVGSHKDWAMHSFATIIKDSS